MSEIINDSKLEAANGGVQIDGVEYYQVKLGDTLSEIAERFHVSTAALAAANKIANPDRIRAGQKLIIPSK